MLPRHPHPPPSQQGHAVGGCSQAPSRRCRWGCSWLWGWGWGRAWWWHWETLPGVVRGSWTPGPWLAAAIPCQRPRWSWAGARWLAAPHGWIRDQGLCSPLGSLHPLVEGTEQGTPGLASCRCAAARMDAPRCPGSGAQGQPAGPGWQGQPLLLLPRHLDPSLSCLGAHWAPLPTWTHPCGSGSTHAARVAHRLQRCCLDAAAPTAPQPPGR